MKILLLAFGRPAFAFLAGVVLWSSNSSEAPAVRFNDEVHEEVRPRARQAPLPKLRVEERENKIEKEEQPAQAPPRTKTEITPRP